MNSAEPKDKAYSSILTASLFFATAYIVYYFTQPAVPNPFNYYIHLSDAFLHGRLYLTDPPVHFEELIKWNGRYYFIYPPMPALILTPFVAIWGFASSQVLASVMLGSANVAIVYLIIKRLTSNTHLQIWMTILFGFGTIHWFTASIGSVWYLAQITSMFFLLLAIYSTFSGRSALLVGLLLGASYWSRLPTILTLPFFMMMLSEYEHKSGSILKRIKIKPILLLVAGVGVFVLLNFAYNYLRFGSPFDVAYKLHSISPIKEKVSPWFNKGLFSLTYIRYHIYAFLLQPPVFTRSWPYVIPALTGLSVLITTPAFIFALFAGIRNKLSLACWSAIVATAFIIFIKSGTGWTQFGYRYALDFYPFLLLLTLKGIGRELKWYHKALIIAGVLVNLWGVLFINKFEWFKLY